MNKIMVCNKILYNKMVFIITNIFIILVFNNSLLRPLYNAKTVNINLLSKNIDLLESYGAIYEFIKSTYLILEVAFLTFAFICIHDLIIKPFYMGILIQKEKEYPYDFNDLKLIVGRRKGDRDWINIKKDGLFQNVLVTGTIGTGKTSSCLYPFTKQLLFYKHNDLNKKCALLILDVKGNYHTKVLEYIDEVKRQQDKIVIEVGGVYKYNPLHKPNLKAQVIANRLRTILELFSNTKTGDTYWLDKAEYMMAYSIKLCRLYNDNYVTFEELHKLINNSKYLEEKIELLKDKFLSDKLSMSEIFELNTIIDYFNDECKALDDRVLSIIKSEVTRITQVFLTDYEIKNTFNSGKDELNFLGFEDFIDEGKVVILNMSIAKYKSLAKIISAYLKLDFQEEVLMRLTREGANKDRPICFISDEYQEFVTASDANFFAVSREAKCINIVSTQSYTSLCNTLKDRDTVSVIVQNLINKIWLRTDDTFTYEEAQKQIGKEDKEKISKSISENAKKTKYNFLTKCFDSYDSDISESISINLSSDFIFDSKIFTQGLKTFEAVVFLSDGSSISKPCVVELESYFNDNVKNIKGECV